MKRVALLALSAVSLTGCGKLHMLFGGGPSYTGSGVLKTETRNVGSFHAIEIGGATEAEVKIGPKLSLQITSDDNLLPHIRTKVENGKLIIDHEGSFTSQNQIKAVITVPSLDSLDVFGAGKMNVTGVQGSKLAIDISGASEITVAGNINAVELDASGASQAKLSALRAKSIKVDASGASQVDVAAEGEISGDVSGASHLRYTGHPKISVSSSGASEVTAK